MKRVLVVDDEVDAREFVRLILEPEGWEVEEAVDADSGLKKAKSLRPDLVIVDVQMPKKDGFQLFADLVKNPDTRDCKVIMLTAVAEKIGIRFSAEDMEQFLGKEPDAYLEKPVEPEALKRIVKKVTSAS